MDHVIKIPGSQTLCQCPDLFSKDFFETIALDTNTVFWPVRVRMMDFTVDWFQSQHLIIC
jgi:hypothetical protein